MKLELIRQVFRKRKLKQIVFRERGDATNFATAWWLVVCDIGLDFSEDNSANSVHAKNTLFRQNASKRPTEG